MPTAIVAAWVPETPPPRTSTLAAATPGTPPSSTPRPPCAFSSACAPTCGARRPATSRHRRQQRQTAMRAGHRLVGDAGRARGHEVARLLEIGREMQVGEQDLPLAEPLALFGERLLDLHDHLGLREDVGRRVDDSAAGADIFLVRRPRAEAGRSLDDDLMAVIDELGDRGRRHADPEFVVLDLLGNADEHGLASESALKTNSWRLSQEILDRTLARRRDARLWLFTFASVISGARLAATDWL